MKGDKLSVSNIESILDAMSGATIYTKLDIFAKYWQI